MGERRDHQRRAPVMYDELLPLLLALDGIRQNPAYHPEGCALYHSLQVFDLARAACPDRALWAAALLHDVGKAISSPDHDALGADLLDGLVSPRIVWLVRHHLDLLHDPGPTKRRLRGTAALADLQRLRRWDVLGRSPHATVMSPEDALSILLDGADLSLLDPGGEPAPIHDPRKELF
ncbi:HD domain-containing protein [Polyangium sp. 15x6]|uniref:HD domain-containing protein n=1 Tax=Polyangium sp. 15x6 TaxID=3042687 RepID=UPI00249C9302|nr:HD domain-containing protein [Polyangium sp. 15x6]MDI3282159.1 HD domain-containing protein [Polyangium sp. 15x6]